MSDLIEQLEAADDKFHRPPVPAVYEEYKAFLATGRYPYNDSVVTDIALKHQVGAAAWKPNQRFHHQAVADLGEPLLRKLHHEVYLASGLRRVEEMEAEAAGWAELGYRPITELEPRVGMRIEMGGKVYRVVPATNGDWALLLPRKRVSGLSLRSLKTQHENFLAATIERQTHHNAPTVRMYKEIG